MNRLLVPRMLVTGSVVTTATAFRVGASWVELVAQRTPPLVRLAIQGLADRGDTGRAPATFRDELIALARDSVEISWREMRRGVDDLDSLTRPDVGHGQPGAQRPYRAKP